LEKDIRRQFVDSVLIWADRNTRDFPWRSNYSPYRVLIAELLLRRTTASAVQRVYEKFLEEYPDLEHLSHANVAELENMLSTLGYQKSRARFIREIANTMWSKYSTVPNSLEALLSIQQVGLYTAAAVISLGFNMPAPMVDSNVLRILSRIYGRHIRQDEAFRLLKDAMPRCFKEFNLALLDFGAMVCRYKNPLCGSCPMKLTCHFALEGRKRTVATG
jgi:A/G-specific adenine glycosylase